ncbi:MAG: tetratricopeptide repeat protein [Akkermansia sp.]|nr:tetratricopeptide repeat protein [Akkermansia sp.]
MDTNKTTNNTDEMPLSPEEIKAIGEIELGPAKHEIFLNNHYKKLIVGGIAFMVAASAAIGYYAYKSEQKEQAGALIVKALGATSVDGAAEPAKYDAKAISEIGAAYADTPSADTAVLLEALSLMSDTARVESGLSMLESLAASTTNELLRARALASLAAHYMTEEQNEKSISYWKQIIALPVNPYTAIAYINLGDMAKLAGDIEGARSFYSTVSTVCPNSAIVRENVAGLRLALLEVDAPKPVTSAEQPAAEQAPAASNPFGIDPNNPFGSATPAAPAESSNPFDTQPTLPSQPAGDTTFGGMSTLPGGAN